MGTTQIDPLKTISEIHACLVRAGARRIMNTYENSEPIAVHFILVISGRDVPFELPARIEPIYKIINAGEYGRNKQRDLDQAKRTAWRQVYRWIQAQIAMIETGMVQATEVFMPYMQVAGKDGEPTTFYQRAIGEGFDHLALPPANEA